VFKPKKVFITGTIVVTVLLLLGGAVFVGQVHEESASIGCESEGLWYVTIALREYADQHSGQLPPTSQEAVAWAAGQKNEVWGELPTGCSKGRFVWSGCRKKTGSVGTRPIVWCNAPHGLYSQWRNVIFSDLSFRRVPESAFALLMQGEKVGPITQFEAIHDVQQNGS
jgi:hypothetical protein